MSLESWWKSLAKERTKRVQSRTRRTLARQESAARVAEAKYHKRTHVTADTGEVVVEPAPPKMNWYVPAALGVGLLWMMRKKE